MKTIAFFGGSNVSGAGYPDEKFCQDIYPNVVASQGGYDIKNYGIGGASSYEIFLTCMEKIAQTPSPDIVIIEWNMFSRYRFHPSPEVELSISGATVTLPDSWAHCIPMSKKQIEHFQEILLLLDGDYHRMITLLTYCIIIQSICKLKNIKLGMIGSDILWTTDMFRNYTLESNLGSSLSDYTKQLLDFDNRDDVDILQLLSTLKEKFNQIDPIFWIFGFETIKDLTTDYAPIDHVHPGPDTMKIVAGRIINFLKEKIV
jgi:hypothetical protein